MTRNSSLSFVATTARLLLFLFCCCSFDSCKYTLTANQSLFTSSGCLVKVQCNNNINATCCICLDWQKKLKICHQMDFTWNGEEGDSFLCRFQCDRTFFSLAFSRSTFDFRSKFHVYFITITFSRALTYRSVAAAMWLCTFTHITVRYRIVPILMFSIFRIFRARKSETLFQSHSRSRCSSSWLRSIKTFSDNSQG